MVTLVYRCETDDEVVELNDEHDDHEWAAPGTAAERVEASLGRRFARAVERAAELDGSEELDL